MFQMTSAIAQVNASSTVATNSASAGVSVDKNGVVSKVTKEHFTEIKDPDMLASVTMLAIGFLSALMVKTYNAPLTKDVMVAAAGGTMFIAGEVMSNMKFKGVIDEMTIEVTKKSDGTVNEEQMQRLLDLQKSYEEAKKTTKTKQMLQLAAAATFGISAIIAGYDAVKELAAYNSCLSALTTAKTTCAEAIAKLGIIKKYYTSRSSKMPSSITHKALVPDMAAASKVFTCAPKDPASAAAATAVAATVNGVCTPAVALLIKNQAHTRIPLKISSNDVYRSFQNLGNEKLTQIPSSEESFLNKVVDFIFPKAQASWLPLLGLSGGVLVAFLAIGASSGFHIDRLMFAPGRRTIMFSLLATLSYLASTSSANTIKKIDDNLAKIKKVIEDLNVLAKGVKSKNVIEQGIKLQTLPPADIELYTFSADGKSLTPCMDSDSNVNCKPIEQLRLMAGWGNLPDSFKTTASQALSLGNTLSGANGISGSALSAAADLASKQAAIARMLKNRQDAYNKIPGVKKVDFNKAQQEFFDSLGKSIKEDLRNNGMTAAGMMAGLGTTSINTNDTDEANKKLAKNPFKDLTGITSSVVAPSGEKEEKDLDLNFKEAPTEFVAGAAAISKPEYDVTTDEINKDNGPSIFEVISNRYLKSGYPKLLEEDVVKK